MSHQTELDEADSEVAFDEFLGNLSKLTCLFSLLSLATLFIKEINLETMMLDGTKILQRTIYQDSIELLSILLTVPIYLVLGLRKSLICMLMLTMMPLLGIWYLKERDQQYRMQRDLSRHIEHAQFLHAMKSMQGALLCLLSACVCSLRVAMFCQMNLFPQDRRVRAIGFT